MPRKRQLNTLGDAWLERIRYDDFIIHSVYNTPNGTTENKYTAKSFEEAQKLFASITCQNVEALRDWEDQRRHLVW